MRRANVCLLLPETRKPGVRNTAVCFLGLVVALCKPEQNYDSELSGRLPMSSDCVSPGRRNNIVKKEKESTRTYNYYKCNNIC